MKKLPNTKLLELIDYVCMQGIMTPPQACKKIGYNYSNLSKVRSGKQSFQLEHFMAADKLLKEINYNWLFGKEKNMLRKPPANPIKTIKAATKEIESMFKRC